MIKDFFKNLIFFLKKNKYDFCPIFIIGCGRSGTTILGDTLSQHPNIKYLNERRDIWHKSYPEFNVWSENVKHAKLHVSEDDVDKNKTDILYHLFFREQVIGKASVLLEKIPVNNFRLDFLNTSFPNAKYIYLTRNGIDVSNSIERKISKNNWFKGHKYDLLVKYAKKRGTYFEAENNLEKGFLEWKLSITSSDKFFRKIDNNKFIHLSYEGLVENTQESLKEIFSFLKLDINENLIQNLSLNIERKNTNKDTISNKKIMKIGGEILKQTIDNSYSPF